MRAFLRLLLLSITALGGLGAPPAGAALTRPPQLSGPAAGGPVDPSLLFTADRPLLGTLLAHPARIGSTAEPVLTDLAVAPPHLNNLIVSNVSTSGANVSFLTDVATNTLLYTASPLTEFSSAALTTTHQQALSGLAAGTGYRLRALAVSADLGLAALPDVVFTTAQAVPATQPALGSNGQTQISAGIAGLVVDPADPNAVYEAVSVRNTGSVDASDVTITALSAPVGWSFSTPLPMPLDLGALGRGASGVILTRLQTTAVVTGSPPPLLTGAGSVTVSGQTPQSFNLTGAVPALYITKTVDLASAAPGSTVTFTLTVSNAGLGGATGVNVSDLLPSGLTFVGASNGGQLQNGAVVWPPGTLAAGTSGSLTVQAQVAASAANGATITNVAQANSVEIPVAVASSGATIAVTAPPPPQLQLAKMADNTTVQPGQTILYTMTLANVGAGPATNVQIEDSVPAGTTVIGVSQGGTAVSATTVGWVVGTLAAGASASVSVQVQVAAGTTGPLSNVAQARSTEVPTPISSNQGNPVVVTVMPPPPPPPQLTLTKAVDQANISPGGTLTYTLAYANTGTQPFTATLIDPLPAGVTFAGTATSGGQLNGGALQFNLGTLAPGTNGSVSFSVQVGASVPSGTTLMNQAQISGPGLAQPLQSNAVSTTVVAPTVPPPVSTGSGFAGTWSSLPTNMPPPATPHASLTVDAQGKFTVWARSPDGQTVAESAQGMLSASGSYDVMSTDMLVHFTGQVAADGSTAMMTAARSGFVPFTITASRRPDVGALPAALVGTFTGSGAGANGDRFQVWLSIDPGGNATLEADVIQSTSGGAKQFATLQVSPNGVVTSPTSSSAIAALQAANGGLTLQYHFVVSETGYQNTFQVSLSGSG